MVYVGEEEYTNPEVTRVAKVLAGRLEQEVLVDHRIDDAISIWIHWDDEDSTLAIFGYQDGEWTFVKDYDVPLDDENIALYLGMIRSS